MRFIWLLYIFLLFVTVVPGWTNDTITIPHFDSPPQAADILMVSNSPEKLGAYGVWAQGEIEPGTTLRLLYHHVNITGLAARLAVEISNTGNEAAKIRIMGAGAGPSGDEIYVGHTAAALFMERRTDDAGYILTLLPGRRYRYLQHAMPPGSIASGIAEFRLLSGPAVTIQVRLNRPEDEAVLLPVDGRRGDPGQKRWKFPDPKRTLKASYEVGKGSTSITLGGSDYARGVAGEVLNGNYGVIYQIELLLDNPSDRGMWIDLVMSARGGPARAVAFINGQKVESGLVEGKQERRLCAFYLSPGERKTVEIETMPESGSFYPVLLIARARE